MIEPDAQTVESMWRAADLTRAYLAQDRAVVQECLAGVDTDALDHVLAWLSLDHDALFDDLGEPSMSVREIDALAALAPLDAEIAVTTTVHRVASGETGLLAALEDLGRRDQIHAVAICTAVMLLEAVGRADALKMLDEDTAEYVRRGHPRPYTIT